MNIDIGNLRAFCVVAEKESFTLAGELLGATQSTISMRVKKLEHLLGNKLFDSSPHGVELTDFGHDFIPKAQELLGAHDAALYELTGNSERHSFRLGITSHATQTSIKEILSEIGQNFPQYRIVLTIAGSEELYTDFGRSKYDAIVARRGKGDVAGTALFSGELSWMMAKDLHYDRDQPVPLVSIASPCSLRQTAIMALNSSKIPWQETFVGTSVSTVRAAVSAGLGIVCLDKGNLPNDCQLVPDEWNFPKLPATDIIMHATKPALKRHGKLVGIIEKSFKQTLTKH